MSLIIHTNAECHYAECHYADCRYAECRGALLGSLPVDIALPGLTQRYFPDPVSPLSGRTCR